MGDLSKGVYTDRWQTESSFIRAGIEAQVKTILNIVMCFFKESVLRILCIFFWAGSDASLLIPRSPRHESPGVRGTHPDPQGSPLGLGASNCAGTGAWSPGLALGCLSGPDRLVCTGFSSKILEFLLISMISQACSLPPTPRLPPTD